MTYVEIVEVSRLIGLHVELRATLYIQLYTWRGQESKQGSHESATAKRVQPRQAQLLPDVLLISPLEHSGWEWLATPKR